ncbi:polysaccharide biosynthesis protein [Desulfohalovibrio reitneri]|uniref:polysaccharide biosynthesis protein n=1 Tax=Desulfohalovibrio reitneri TaxID=1307759 RepID=UPI0005567061|nr:nucleoside-diphosphate sugar epimerase/dehydratase [Desulfohalovibrio reitneri]
MHRQLRNPNFYAMLLADAVLFSAALSLAYLIRFEFSLSPYYADQLYTFLPFVTGAKLAVYFAFGLYRGMWRYTSFYELWRLVKAAVLATVLLATAALFILGFEGYSRSVLLLDSMLAIVFTGGLRIAIRRAFEHGSFTAALRSALSSRVSEAGRRVLIAGAGDAGEQLLRQVSRDPELGLTVAGFVDDDPDKMGRSLHGVPVLGEIGDLPLLAEKEEADEIIIALPQATGEQMRRVVAACEETGLPFRTLPGYSELLGGEVTLRSLREVNMEDLLGREPVALETDRIASCLTGKVVLVTGCGGSIGSELCRQIAPYRPARMILLDSGEYNLYTVQMELHHELGFEDYVPVLGKVQDQGLLDRVFATHAPQVVFHAAAYKHVPLMEINPWEAVHNNIQASRRLMETAVRFQAERFVLVSTDKAVRPTNVMGASKRVTELLLQSLTGGRTRFMSVRFGNVIGSSGSVIPLFMDQIRRGGPVTVTHPDVTRYFMTISEAAQLILQAATMGEEGEIFLLKMGQPVKIADMARDLIRLAGKVPDRDVEIRYTGLRPGEKLFEELITAGEDVTPTGHEKILRLRADDSWYGLGSREDMRTWLVQRLEELYGLAEAFDHCGIKAKLAEVVREYEMREESCVLETSPDAAAEEA